MTNIRNARIVSKAEKGRYEDQDVYSKSSDIIVWNIFEQDYETIIELGLSELYSDEEFNERQNNTKRREVGISMPRKAGSKDFRETRADGTSFKVNTRINDSHPLWVLRFLGLDDKPTPWGFPKGKPYHFSRVSPEHIEGKRMAQARRRGDNDVFQSGTQGTRTRSNRTGGASRQGNRTNNRQFG